MEDSQEPRVKDDLEKLSFEEAFLQIEKIVKTLESGRGELEESLDNYERAVRLVRLCRNRLDVAVQRIEMLKGLDSDGTLIVEPVDAEALRSNPEVVGRQASSMSESEGLSQEISVISISKTSDSNVKSSVHKSPETSTEPNADAPPF